MGRPKRAWVSHLTGNDTRLNDGEKEYFMGLMEKFASGFFVDIHAFAIMSNHFHILATGLESDAKKASPEELKERYRQMYGKNAEPPEGIYTGNGTLIPDEDGGIARLRVRNGDRSVLGGAIAFWHEKGRKKKVENVSQSYYNSHQRP